MYGLYLNGKTIMGDLLKKNGSTFGFRYMFCINILDIFQRELLIQYHFTFKQQLLNKQV